MLFASSTGQSTHSSIVHSPFGGSVTVDNFLVAVKRMLQNTKKVASKTVNNSSDSNTEFNLSSSQLLKITQKEDCGSNLNSKKKPEHSVHTDV